jgi:hypothetical protein
MAGERVTDAELKAILVDSEDVVVTGFIVDAHFLVDEYLLGQGLSEDRLTIIEKYLAAHLYVLSAERGGLIRERIGESDQQYTTPGKGSGLASTRFGQMVLGFDTTGLLEASLVGGTKRARITMVSPTPDLPYDGYIQ